MRLDHAQLDLYRHDGYLEFPELLSPDEVAALNAGVPMLQSDRRGQADANVYTTAGGIRSSYSPRLDSRAFAALVRVDRVLGPIRQLVDGEVYLYQSRPNAKPRRDQGTAMFQVYSRDDNRPRGTSGVGRIEAGGCSSTDTSVLAPVSDRALATLAPAA